MFKITVLICSMHLSAQDCQPDTAIDQIVSPQMVTMQQCIQQGQSMITGGLAPTAGGDGTFAKIICTGERQ